MISLDIECSGLDFNKSGIWQIGAVDLETGEEFLEECRIDDDDLILDVPDSKKKVLEIIGKTEEELRDENKQSQKEMIEGFFDWLSKRKKDIFICHNPQFDISYIWAKARKYELKIEFQFKAFDVHTIAQMKYMEVNDAFYFVDGKSKMGVKDACKFCGLEYTTGFHNGLEDAKFTGECFHRLVYGNSFFERFKAFEVPKYLKK
jgi:DNA polymerase III epsilon subunit-like protein